MTGIECFLAGVGVVLLCLFVGLAIFLQRAEFYAMKLLFDLPWMTWHSIDDAVESGCPRFWCRLLLPLLAEEGYTEVRPKDDLSEDEHELVESVGYHGMTVELHDFRLLKKGGRRKRKKLSLPRLNWSPVPA